MYGQGALGCSPAVEGAFVLGDYNVSSSVVQPKAAGMRAGFGGVALGRFAWANPNGVAFNQRNSSHDLLGIVVPYIGIPVDWRYVYYDDATQTNRLREGLPLTMLATGNVWARFEEGAISGEPVYANVDGSAHSGYIAGGELTAWSVMSNCPAGQLAIISTWRIPQ